MSPATTGPDRGRPLSATRLRDLKLCGAALLIMAAFAGVHWIALDLPWLRGLELSALDAQIRLRGTRPPGPETVIVMIDDRTIAELGQWPVPRRSMAELITALHRAGARVIAIDVLFADPEPTAAALANGPSAGAGDSALAQAIAAAGNVVLPFTFKFDGGGAGKGAPSAIGEAYAQLHKDRDYRPLGLQPTGALTPLASLAAAATLGHVLVAYDVDGAPRYDYPALEYDLDYYPSMAVRAAQHFLGVPWNEVDLVLGRGVALGRVFVPTDAQMRMLVDYLGPPHTFPTYSLSQVLAGKVPASVFRDRVVLVGADALGTRDTFQTPFTSVMPGVERLATAIDSILHERHLIRPDTMAWLEVGMMLASALVMGLAMSRLSLAAAFLWAAACVVAIAASSQILLVRYGVWQASAVPIVAVVLTFTVLSLYRYGLLDREQRHVRRVFQRYLAPGMVDQIVGSRRLPELGGELREITVLFCDLRGFTTLSERLDPASLTRVVNTFFGMATEAVLEQRGTVDKYLGDAIMAFWNAPTDQPDHAARACRAALRILEKLRAYNASAVQDGEATRLEVSVGINTGPCTVGNFGSSHRFDYSAIGDAVNVAARLQGETKAYGTSILIGPDTAAQAAGFATRPIDRIQLRGRLEPLQVYALVGEGYVDAATSASSLSSQ